MQAIVLAGGSAFGLAAADGVVARPRGRGSGSSARSPGWCRSCPPRSSSISASAIARVRPDAAAGRSRLSAPPPMNRWRWVRWGPVPGRSSPGGAVSSTCARAGWVRRRYGWAEATVGALAVVNAVGDVFTLEGESLTGGDRSPGRSGGSRAPGEHHPGRRRHRRSLSIVPPCCRSVRAGPRRPGRLSAAQPHPIRRRCRLRRVVRHRGCRPRCPGSGGVPRRGPVDRGGAAPRHHAGRHPGGGGVVSDDRRRVWRNSPPRRRGAPLCPLAATRTHVVFGDGGPEADVMFVGEAPGFHEDQQGVPFVGAAGKLLDRLLGEIGLRRDRGLHRQRAQVPAARQPRSASRRDRGLPGLPPPPVGAGRSPGRGDAGQLRHQAAAQARGRHHPVARPGVSVVAPVAWCPPSTRRPRCGAAIGCSTRCGRTSPSWPASSKIPAVPESPRPESSSWGCSHDPGALPGRGRHPRASAGGWPACCVPATCVLLAGDLGAGKTVFAGGHRRRVWGSRTRW